MLNVKCLILSSSIDYSTDLICIELERLDICYLRINRDFFNSYSIEYSLSSEQLLVSHNGIEYLVCDEFLKSVYFRAPVFLRITGKELPLETQVFRTQWSSFIRNLIVFSAKWVNHPVDTYRAENKMLQLLTAKHCGLLIPDTIITNSPKGLDDNKLYISKSLDTAFFYERGNEMFCYSEVVSGSELKEYDLSIAPVIIQNFLSEKIDIRVTVVSDKMFPVSITKDNNPIHGDWRKTKKGELQYSSIKLPKEIETAIFELMTKLNLKFAGVDLALTNGKYYFIEANPTGEWAWLTNDTDRQIEKAIISALID